MTDLQCILCQNHDVHVNETIPTKQLVDLYRRRAGVDVSRFFKGPSIMYCICGTCGLGFYWPQAVGDGRFYDDLQEYEGYYIPEKEEFKIAAKFITSGDNVLEVGSGEGLFTGYIQCKSYTGLEFSEKAIEKARRKGITLLNESLEEHARMNSEKYDVVCYFQVLEHVPEPGKFIKDSLACLKKGGKLIIAVPSEDSFIRNAINFYLNMPPHHCSRWTDHTLTKVAELNKLSILQIFHENLLSLHRPFYFKTSINSYLRSKFNRSYRAVDNDLLATSLYALSVLAAPVRSLFSPTAERITGQGVTVVYEK
jgi:2-polyprenyl-3-methyl-5-hydroxy-6-metoxy-1,4-benzoquinol methylase